MQCALALCVMSVYNKTQKVKARAGTNSDPNLNFTTLRCLALKRQAFLLYSSHSLSSIEKQAGEITQNNKPSSSSCSTLWRERTHDALPCLCFSLIASLMLPDVSFK